MNNIDRSIIEIIQKRELLLTQEEATQQLLDEILDYENQIIELIKENFNSLELDFIFIQLSHLGQAPNLLYDDNGHWAVTSDGFQSISMEDEPKDTELWFHVEAKQWKKTPREALKEYLFEN